MTSFGILTLIFSTMYTAQSVTESPVYQPDKELSVAIGDSATLRCCTSEKQIGTIVWFKQPKRQKPQYIVIAYKTGEKFYSKSAESHFQIERSTKCLSLTILNITESDEAVYYCALIKTNFVFADGTYLKTEGKLVGMASNPALCDNSVVCEPTLHGNSTNMNTQEKTERTRPPHSTVLGLGTALGLCALLIFCLIYFILRRRTCKNSRMKCVEDCPGTRQEFEAETLNYSIVQFAERKAKAEKRKTGTIDECVYSEVKKTVRCNGNNTQ